jgi:hypothetical protein
VVTELRKSIKGDESSVREFIYTGDIAS